MAATHQKGERVQVLSNITDAKELRATTSDLVVETGSHATYTVDCTNESCAASPFHDGRLVARSDLYDYYAVRPGGPLTRGPSRPSQTGKVESIANVGVFRELAVSGADGCALDPGGSVWCWTEKPVATKVLEGASVVAVGRLFKVGNFGAFGLAIRADRRLWFWALEKPDPQPLF